MGSPFLKSIAKVCVALKKHGNDSSLQITNFLDCLVRYFEPSKHYVNVKYSLLDNILSLYGPISEDELTDAESLPSNVVHLQHSPECPISNLTDKDKEQLPLDVTERGIAIGVSVIVESADCRILMTRRASHLRTFPNAWVPPGGHIELNETLFEAGIRELKEETGLNLDELSATITVLCLWESVYPLLLALDLPKRHHLVVYLHALINKPWEEIHQNIKLDPSEVQACTWLDPGTVKILLTHRTENLNLHEMFKIQDDGSMSSVSLDLKTMFNHLLLREGKVFSGSQLALTKWMEIVSRRSKNICKI